MTDGRAGCIVHIKIILFFFFFSFYYPLPSLFSSISSPGLLLRCLLSGIVSDSIFFLLSPFSSLFYSSSSSSLFLTPLNPLYPQPTHQAFYVCRITSAELFARSQYDYRGAHHRTGGNPTECTERGTVLSLYIDRWVMYPPEPTTHSPQYCIYSPT